jgi:hypothetical protein
MFIIYAYSQTMGMEFINLMQLNIVLYAIKNCTNKEQKDRIRNYYQRSDLNYDSLQNKENLEQMFFGKKRCRILQ